MIKYDLYIYEGVGWAANTQQDYSYLLLLLLYLWKHSYLNTDAQTIHLLLLSKWYCSRFTNKSMTTNNMKEFRLRLTTSPQSSSICFGCYLLFDSLIASRACPSSYKQQYQFADFFSRFKYKLNALERLACVSYACT